MVHLHTMHSRSSLIRSDCHPSGTCPGVEKDPAGSRVTHSLLYGLDKYVDWPRRTQGLKCTDALLLYGKNPRCGIEKKDSVGPVIGLWWITTGCCALLIFMWRSGSGRMSPLKGIVGSGFYWNVGEIPLYRAVNIVDINKSSVYWNGSAWGDL